MTGEALVYRIVVVVHQILGVLLVFWHPPEK
jgi:hypothetical protein